MHREDGHVRIKAKLQLKPKNWSDGIKKPKNAKDCQQPPETRRGARKDSSLELWKRHGPQTPQFHISETVKEYISVVLRDLDCRTLLQQSWKIDTVIFISA